VYVAYRFDASAAAGAKDGCERKFYGDAFVRGFTCENVVEGTSASTVRVCEKVYFSLDCCAVYRFVAAMYSDEFGVSFDASYGFVQFLDSLGAYLYAFVYGNRGLVRRFEGWILFGVRVVPQNDRVVARTFCGKPHPRGCGARLGRGMHELVHTPGS